MGVSSLKINIIIIIIIIINSIFRPVAGEEAGELEPPQKFSDLN